MAKPDAIAELIEVMAALRDPKTGCPWDIEQDSASIAPHTIEEAYEVADAIFSGDAHTVKDELGDLLFNVIYHSQIAKEQGIFDFYDVAATSSEKMIRRHPHVFDNAHIDGVAEQNEAWEEIKRQERGGATSSITDGILVGLPQLIRAQKIGRRVARCGFDWPSVDGAIDKIDEEIIELKEAVSLKHDDSIEDELGDVLFSLCNLARHLDLDAETALLKANNKFISRFKRLEELVQADEANVQELDISELEHYWQMAKSFTQPS